jgi:two-component system chemotaxis response regulator CheY
MSKRVLIVDDAIFMRMKLKDILESNGYEVVAEAQNGAEAIEKFKSERPDLVTMDITMPEMDGIEALRGIRAIDSQAKVVMCSAMGQQAMVMESIQSGAVDFIVKPFDSDRVIQSLNKVVR